MGEIQKALGMAEPFVLKDGSSINIYPAKLSYLENVIPLYEKVVQKTLHGLFMKGHEESRTALRELLLRASGNAALLDDEEKAEEMFKELLDRFDPDDGAPDLYRYIRRFLRLEPRDAAGEEKQAE